jgi:hypothetical protein
MVSAAVDAIGIKHNKMQYAEPNADKIEYINLIESVRFKQCDGTPL